MLSFIEFNNQLQETVLSIGLNSKHEQYREQHRQEIYDMITKSYAKIGGFSGLGSESKEESDSIHSEISDTSNIIKGVKRNGKLTAINFYKNQYGRKSYISATDGTPQGKQDWLKIKLEDHEQQRAWGEASGAVEHIYNKIGNPVIPIDIASKIINKPITPLNDGEKYSRKIGGKEHIKTAYGHPKIPT